MDYLTQLEKIIHSEHRLISIETTSIDRVSDLFLELSRFSEKPYYMASPQQAMYRLGAPHIRIPRTQTPFGLIEHIEASKYFGVFILRSQNELLQNSEIVKKLKTIATADAHKILIFLGENVSIPAELKGVMVRATHKKNKAA